MTKSNEAAAWPGNAASNSKPPVPASGASTSAAPAATGLGRKALRVASIALAITIGATGGTFSALGFLQWASPAATDAAPMPTMVDETRILQDTIMQLRADLTSLKTAVETSAARTNGEFLKTGERIDRLDRAQSELRWSGADVTGSVQAAPAPSATARRQRVGVPGWSVRDVYRNAAMIQGSGYGMIEVSPGDTVPGLGRVHSIRQQDGRWVVVTSKGIITSTPR